MQSSNIQAIFPYLHPEYPKLMEIVLKNQGSVELIIPKCIFKEFILKIDEKIRKKSIRVGKLKAKSVMVFPLWAVDRTFQEALFWRRYATESRIFSRLHRRTGRFGKKPHIPAVRGTPAYNLNFCTSSSRLWASPARLSALRFRAELLPEICREIEEKN